jgi:TPR repeat protein
MANANISQQNGTSDSRILLDRACTLGNIEGCLALAKDFKTGPGGSIDRKKADEIYERLRSAYSTDCEKENGFSCKRLGDMWSDGLLGKIDKNKADEYYARERELHEKSMR